MSNNNSSNVNNIRNGSGSGISETASQNNLNTDLVRGALDHFETLQVKLNLPTYAGDKSNPAEFLEKMEKYFIRKRINNGQILLITKDYLRGQAWVKMMKKSKFFLLHI